ncbi:MAG: hypothetical protein NTX63_00950 [Candidatus Peregrinibacteria bacterium]|nr:hypothetical protein [Candidatus Peregrinibacteria bacterium]
MSSFCKKCNSSFEIIESDLAFLDKVAPAFNGIKYGINPPTLCPDCRQIRRLTHVNEINLYKRKCDKTGKDILSNYHSSQPHTVYNQEYWWSDDWDALSYGKEYDFSKPFFQQINELFLQVPRPSLFTGFRYDENCDYTNYAGKNKNCYLIFDADYNRDTYYSYSANHDTNCIDGYRTRESELCYESVDCKNCYNCDYIFNSVQCNDSAFLDNCEGCKNCFMSCNQQHKQYFINNRQGTKEEYEALMVELKTHSGVEKYKKEFEELRARTPKKYLHGTQNENVSGDYISNCKDVRESFDCNDVRDGKCIYQSFGSNIKDCQDCDEIGDNAELCYESSNSGYNANHVLFGTNILDQNSDIIYSNHCHYSSNLFGCIGLKRKKYCILNKQYSKEEYEALVPKIVEHMKSTGEWGEHYPETISPFAYNESMAMEYKPLTKEQALAQGLSWREDDKKKVPSTCEIPQSIDQTKDSITQEVLACVTCGSNYKIIPQELEFYRSKGIPIPKKCFKCRHYDRMRTRNPRQLWDQTCTKCSTPIRTSYSPARQRSSKSAPWGEQVLCEKCYLETVY